MCGIAGIINYDKKRIDLEEIQNFTDSMSHRGPDGAGYQLLFDNTVALGHRRLSILDLSSLGKQPMCLNNRYWITYNGEVFNFLELKIELEKNYNIQFKSNSDTEVILYSYYIFGKDCFKKFNGMWAIAIYDLETKKLLLCRDRFGVKPLHYILLNKKLAFASETIAFNKLKDFAKTINTPALLFSLNNPSALEPTNSTIYNNIFQVPPGTFIEFDDIGNFIEKKWWNTFDNLPEVSENYNDNKENFFELFKDACKIRLRSDVPIASALSGGLDSSSVYAMIHYLSKNKLINNRTPNDWKKAVVACFPNSEVDEKKYADEVVNFLKASVIYTQPDYSNLANEIIETTKKFDSISGTPIVSVTDVYKAMRNSGIVVSMDGHGGDEILFGYKSSILKLFDFYLNNKDYVNAKMVASTYSKMGKSENENKVFENFMQQIELARKENFLSTCKKNLKNIIFNSKQKPTIFDNWFKKGDFTYTFNPLKNNINGDTKILVDDFFIDHLPYNLRDFDRGAMQNGIEIRMPLMDYRLVTFCFALKTNHKVNDHYTKFILRDSVKGLLPESIRLRTNKIGLGAPTKEWFNNHLAEFICDQVNSTNFLNSNYWNGKEINEFVQTTTKSKTWTDLSANKFWNILNAHILINE